MGWVLRRSSDKVNPTLPGGVYGLYITAGIGVFWWFDGARIRFILFISDGGRYGMDSITELSYKGNTIPVEDFSFKPGTLTRQIVPFAVTAVSVADNTFTAPGLGLANYAPVRFRTRGGDNPGGIKDEKLWVYDKAGDVYKLSSTDPVSATTPVDITSAGAGTLKVWHAVAGWDDPVQGLSLYSPQVKTTFSGIALADGMLPEQYNTNEEPDWSDFRIQGVGRKLMDYDAAGNETGVVSGGEAEPLLRNPALVGADVLVAEYKKPLSRFNWASWFALREASPAPVWQRTDTTQGGTGWVAKYFNYEGGGIPDIEDGTLVVTRRDETIDFDFGTAAPAPGVDGDFFAIWEAQVKPPYTETFTIEVERDNGARVYVDEVLKLNSWTDTFTTESFTVDLIAGELAQFRVEFFDAGGPGKLRVRWESASQPKEIIPMQSVYEPDVQVPLQEYNGAAATPTEAAEYFERVMESCPGWDWTDKNGKIVFLGPDREIAYDFVFDAEDPDVRATFLDRTFEKTLRHRRDRRNFALWSFRNRLYTGFPEGFVEENRPRLRGLGNGMPNNNQPEDLMVMHRNQAQRVASAEFKLTSDPTHTLSLSAPKPSGVVTKAQYVRVRNWVKGDKRVEDSVCLVTSVNRQGKTLDFSLLPIEFPFDLGVEFVEEGED